MNGIPSFGVSRLKILMILCLVAIAPLASAAAPSLVGTPIPVNQYTPGWQTTFTHGRAIAGDAQGNFVAVWQSDQSPTGGPVSIRGRAFDATGTPVTDEFRVNTNTTAGFWVEPAIAMSPGGNGVIVWTSFDSDSYGVFAQRITSAGQFAGPEFRINQTIAGGQHHPSVAMYDDGSFIVAFARNPGFSGQYHQAYARRFDAQGNATTGDFFLVQYPAGPQQHPEVAVLPDGGFVAAWAGYGQDGNLSNCIMGRIFAADNTALTPAFTVTQTTTGSQWYPAVAVSGSSILIAWEGPGTGDTSGIFGRRFDLTGAPLSNEFRLNTVTSGGQSAVSIAAVQDGGFFASWNTGSQRLKADGTFDGGEVSLGSLPSTFMNGWDGVVLLTVPDANQFGPAAQRLHFCDPPLTDPVINAPAAVCEVEVGQASISGSYDSIAWSITNGTITGPADGSLVEFQGNGNWPITLDATVTTGGCQASDTVTIAEKVLAPVILVSPSSVCENGSDGSAAVENAPNYAGFSWSITNGVLTTPSTSSFVSYRATTSDPVQLSVIVTDFEGCTAGATQSVPIRTLAPPAILVSPSSVCENGTDGSAAVENSSAYSTFSWSITNGVLTTPSTSSFVSYRATTSDPVQLSVIVTDFEGCTAAATQSVPIRTLAPPTILVSPSSVCENGTDGSAAVENSPNYAAFSWSITNGVLTTPPTSSFVSFRATTSGPVQLSVIVTDFQGCTAGATQSVPIRTIAPPAIIYSPAALCENGEGVASIEGSANYTGFSWSITNGVLLSSPEGITARFVADSSLPVELSLTVADSGGCTASSSVSIPVNTITTPVVTPSGDTTFCAGGSVTLTAPEGYASYSWSTGESTPSIVVTQGNEYSVTVTNAAGCSATSAGTIVTVHSVPATPEITALGETTFCDGGSVELTTAPAVSYLWSNGATTQTITVSTSADYTVTVFNGEGCSTTSAPLTVVANPPLTRPTITASGPLTFCSGGSVDLTAHVSGGSGVYSYQWYHVGMPIEGATSQVYHANPPSLDYYYVIVTDSLGCVSMSSEAAVIHVKPLPDATITAPASACAGSTQSASVPDAGPGAVYNWTVTGGTFNFTMANAVFFTAGESGAVTLAVTVTTADGCSATGSAAMNIDPNPSNEIIAPAEICAGGTGTATAADAGPGATYNWSISGGTITSADGANVSFIAGTSGTVTLNVFITTAAGCAANGTASIDINPTPVATITPLGPTTFCDGGQVTLSAPAGMASYSWSTGATTRTIDANASGEYTVTVMSAAGCTATGSIGVTENAPLTKPAVSAGGATTFCNGGQVALTATPGGGSGGYTFQWYSGSGPIAGQTGITYTATTSGSYSVVVTDSLGCSSTASDPVAVTVNASTAITQQPASATIPKNTTATLTVTATGSGTLAYQWYRGTSGNTSQPVSGATNASYTTPKLNRGTYTYWVRVTGGCGTVNSNTATITAN